MIVTILLIIIIFLLYRSHKKKNSVKKTESQYKYDFIKTCPQCGYVVDEGDNACSHCGKILHPERLPQNKNVAPEAKFQNCESCGHLLPPFSKFCPCCGYRASGNKPYPTYSQDLTSCPVCGSVVDGNDDTCQYCGHALDSEPADKVKKCNHCGLTIPPNSDFCPYCGKRVYNGSLISDPSRLFTGEKKWAIVISAAVVIIILAAMYNSLSSMPTATHPKDDSQTKSQNETVKDNSTKKPAVTTVKEQSAVITKGEVPTTVPKTTTTPTTTEKETTAKTDKIIEQKTISKQVIYSDKGIVITIESINGLESIDFSIQNNGESDLTFNGASVAINECMLKTDIDFSLLTPHNKIIDSIDISAVSYYGINLIEDIDIYFMIEDEDGHGLKVPILHIDLVDKKTFEYKPSGDLVYDSKNISMYVESSGSELDDINAIYYNKSDEIVKARVDGTAINGVMLSGYSDTVFFTPYIFPNCYYYTGSTDAYDYLLHGVKNEIKEKGLTSIEKLSGKIIVRNLDYDKIDESKAVTIYSNEQ